MERNKNNILAWRKMGMAAMGDNNGAECHAWRRMAAEQLEEQEQ